MIHNERKRKLSEGSNFSIIPYTLGDMAGRPPTKEAPRFGQRLAALRKARGLSQEELAAQLGTSRANLAYYERKAGNPTLEFILRCAEILGVTSATLIGDEVKEHHRKPGPKSKLDKQFEHISQLPRQRQQFVSKVLEEMLGTEELAALALPGHNTRYGGGGMFAYEALNLVDGKRTVSDIRDWLVAELGEVSLQDVAEYLQALESIDVIRR